MQTILIEVMNTTRDEALVLERPRIMFPNLLDLVLDLPSQSIYGKELYPTIWEKAAVYLKEIIRCHVLEGACKRVGYMSAYTFLRINNYELECNDEEADRFCVKVAEGLADIEEIAEWLRSNSVFLPS